MAYYHKKIGTEILEFLNDHDRMPVLVGDNYFQKLVETLKKLETKTDSDFRIKKQLLDRVESLENDHKKSMPPGYSGYNNIVNLSALNNYLDGYRDSVKDRNNAAKNAPKTDDMPLGNKKKEKEIVDFRQELVDFLKENQGDSPFKSNFDETPTKEMVSLMKSAKPKTSGKRTAEDRKATHHFQNKKNQLLEKASKLGVNGSTTDDSSEQKKIHRNYRQRGKKQTTEDSNQELGTPRRNLRQRRPPGARLDS
jgi:hypothetical protein